jgi:hypothetical protein
MLEKLRNLRKLIAEERELTGDLVLRHQLLDMLDDIIKDAEVETIKVYEEKALNLIKENL